MNKKFLSIFALVALLVAAMAGVAFAAVDVDVTKATHNASNVGAITIAPDATNPNTDPQTATANAFYYDPSALATPPALEFDLTLTFGGTPTAGKTYVFGNTAAAGEMSFGAYTPPNWTPAAYVDVTSVTTTTHVTVTDQWAYDTAETIAGIKVTSADTVAVDSKLTTDFSLTPLNVKTDLDAVKTKWFVVATEANPSGKVAGANAAIATKGDKIEAVLDFGNNPLGTYSFAGFGYAVRQNGQPITDTDYIPFDVKFDKTTNTFTVTAKDMAATTVEEAFTVDFILTGPVSIVEAADGPVITVAGTNDKTSIAAPQLVIEVVKPAPKIEFTPTSGIEKDEDDNYFVYVGQNLKTANATVKVALLNAAGYSVKSTDVTVAPAVISGKGSAGAVFTLEGTPKAVGSVTVTVDALIVGKDGKTPATSTQVPGVVDPNGIFTADFELLVKGPELVFDPVTIADATVGAEYPATNVKLSIAGVTPAPTITKVEVTPNQNSADGIDVTASAPGGSPYIRFSGKPTEAGYVSADVTVTYKNASGTDVKVPSNPTKPFVLKVNEKTYGLGFTIADERFTQNDDGSFAIDISEVDGVLEELEVALVVADQPTGSAINDVELGFLGGAAAANLDAAGGKKLVLNSDGLKVGEVSFDVTVTLEDALKIPLTQKAFGKFVLAITSGDVPPPPAEYTLTVSPDAFTMTEFDEFTGEFDITIVDVDGEEVDYNDFDIAVTTPEWLEATLVDQNVALAGQPEEPGEETVEVTATYTDADGVEQTLTATVAITVEAYVQNFGLTFDTEFDGVAVIGDVLDEAVALEIVLPSDYVGDAALSEIVSFEVTGAEEVGLTVEEIEIADGLAFGITGTAIEEGEVSVYVVASVVNAPEGVDSVSNTYTFEVQAYVPPTPTPVIDPAETDATIEGVNVLSPSEVAAGIVTQAYPAPAGTALNPFNALYAFSSVRVEIAAEEDDAAALELWVPVEGTLIETIVTNATTLDEMYAAFDRSMDIYYDYLDKDGVSTGNPSHLVGRGGLRSWKEAFEGGFVYAGEDEDENEYIVVNYIVVNGVGSPTVAKDFFVVYDGVADDGKILDPMVLTARKADSSSGSSGCDAGFGAFALLGLAGLALLRKKD